MADPNFRRTVILLCDHTLEGSFGLVLNRPAHVRIAEAAVQPLPFDADLWHGGPVQPETLHVLHPFGTMIEGALPVVEGVYWGGNFEQMKEGFAEGWLDADTVRFFVGYSGWGAGQLDAEVEESAWIVTDATSDVVFAEDGDLLWRRMLRRMGGEYALLSTFPDNPRMN